MNEILIKMIPEFIRNILNSKLFIKIDVALFRVIPTDCNALMPSYHLIYLIVVSEADRTI